MPLSDEQQEAPATEAITRVNPKRRVVDIRVIATFPGTNRRYHWESWDKFEARLRREVKYFYDFLRDHRSQDAIDLEIEPEYETVCNACGEEWEPFTEADGTVTCAYCGGLIKEPEHAPE